MSFPVARSGCGQTIGEATFLCQAGKVPLGHDFRSLRPADLPPYGGETDGTGMPTSKGWEVEVEVVPAEAE